MIVCIWGSTKEAVGELYKKLPKVEGEYSVTWRLTDSFDGPVGHACFAPDHESIEDVYREAKLRVLRVKAPKPKKAKAESKT